MPIHIEQVTTDVAVFDGELPLSEAQLDALVKLVAARLADGRRVDRERERAAQLLRPSVLPEAC
jgi:hypothetical protein